MIYLKLNFFPILDLMYRPAIGNLNSYSWSVIITEDGSGEKEMRVGRGSEAAATRDLFGPYM